MQSTATTSVIEPPHISRRPRILLLSDVQPENASGGQIVLYRHLVASGDYDLLSDTPAVPSLFQSKAWRRIKSTRLFRFTNTLEELIVSNTPSPQCVIKAAAFTPDVILTVAHGRGYDQARNLAKRLHVPLVTIYHDWWPDIDDVLPGWNWLATRRFRRIARQSALCLCVSNQMKTALASPDNTVVLPPIPGPAPPPNISLPENPRFTIGYFGSLYDYGPMMADLAEAALCQSDINLEIRCRRPDWPRNLIERYTAADILLPYAPREDFETWLVSLDATLSVMSFDPRLKKRMETSFPSKLVESLQFGKPVIIWGPEYCAAVQWARRRNACLCITTPDPKTALREMMELAADNGRQQQLMDAASQAVASDLKPDHIHNQFRDCLQRAIGNTPAISF